MLKKFIPLTVIALLSLVSKNAHSQSSAYGQVNDNAATGIAGARITLFNAALTYFREIRTDATGAFTIPNVPAGNYFIGAEKMNKNYVQQSVTVPLGAPVSATLFNETQPGQWNILVNAPEPLGGTNLGALMPDGKIFYCHETVDPFYFDPSINNVVSVPGSGSVQGCVGPIQKADGKLWFIGGALTPSYGPGSRKVKYFDPVSNAWQFQPDMLDYRWYPSVVKLADNKILIAGGGGLNNPVRTNTSEIYNPATGTSVFTDTLAIGNEVSPIVLLYNGKVLMTHRPPQLFNPATNQWASAGPFVQSPRTPNGDHADHELVLMPNGEVIAVGYESFTAGVYGSFIERYNPTLDSWSSGSSILPIRSRAKTVLLPDKKILTIGGFKENPSDTTSINAYGYMNLCDQYNPASDSWRRLARLNYKREYHCNAILVPDGRVIAVGGEGSPGNEPPFSVIEAFTPPYLYRGVRPSITSIDTVDFKRGEQISFTVAYADSLTAVQLISNAVVTHFMNSGNNRFLALSFNQSSNNIVATIPSDSVTAPDGYYMLFAMVDDIPSVAKIIRVLGTASPCVPPTASATAASTTTFCTGGNVVLNALVQANSTYQWEKGGVNISGAVTSTYSATSSGGYSYVTTNSCGSTPSNVINITVDAAIPARPGIINGTAKPCPGTNGVPFSIIAVTNATSYTWTANNGATIAGGQGTTNVTINFPANYISGSISVTSGNSCGTSAVRAKSLSRNIPSTPGLISGQASALCGGVTITYTINAVVGATIYTWTVPSGVTINGGQGTTSLTAQFPNMFSSGTISVIASNSCGSSAKRNLAVSGDPAKPGTITGSTTPCANQTLTYSIVVVSGASSYIWTKPSGATITSGQGTTSATIQFGTSSGTVGVKSNNACGTSSTKGLLVTISCREGNFSAENNFNEIIYPNPANSEININFSTEDDFEIDILNALGQRMIKIKNQSKIDISQLSKGIYFIKVKQENNFSSQKFIKL